MRRRLILRRHLLGLCWALARPICSCSPRTSLRTRPILHASRPSWPGEMVVLRGGFVMTVSKNGSHRTCAAAASSDPEQARSRAVSPLCQRMIGDMELAGLSLSTQQCYLRAVVALQRHTGTRPDRLTEEQVYQYVLWLRDTRPRTSLRTRPILHASRPSWPGEMVVLRGGFVMTVSKKEY